MKYTDKKQNEYFICDCNKAIQYEKLKDIPVLEIKNIMIHVLDKNSDHKQNLELDEFSIKLSNGDITYE